MFYEIKTINGVKTKVPLTSQINSTMPIGFLMANDQDIKPVNYLKCDGSTFDQSQYPGLYTYLGTNVLPTLFDHNRLGDWETVTISGDPSNPTVMQYDGYLTVKDTYTSNNGFSSIFVDGVSVNQVNMAGATGDAAYNADGTLIPFKKGQSIYIYTYNTRGVERHIAYYTHPLFIKALDGVDITDESAIFEEINKHNSYSTTEEIATGATWIDGKLIYRKVFADMTGTTWTSSRNLVGTIANLDKMVRIEASAVVGSTTNFVTNVQASSTAITGLVDMTNGNVYVDIDNISTSYPKTAIVEYTKTTD